MIIFDLPCEIGVPLLKYRKWDWGVRSIGHQLEHCFGCFVAKNGKGRRAGRQVDRFRDGEWKEKDDIRELDLTSK